VNNDPFFGFLTLRSVMKRGGRGPTWALILLGLILVAVGLAFDGSLLVAMGAVVVLVGVWPILAARGSRRRAELLAEHAKREDEILGAARKIVNEAVGATADRGSLAVLIAADPPAADFARRDCLRRAAAAEGAERDAWLDAANEIGRVRSPEEISG
jgi:hypothetical protein